MAWHPMSELVKYLYLIVIIISIPQLLLGIDLHPSLMYIQSVIDGYTEGEMLRNLLS